MSIVQEAYVGYHYRFEKSADANVGHRPVTSHHGHATLTFVKGERRWSALSLPRSGTRVMDHICHHWSRRGLREVRGVCTPGFLSAPSSYIPL